MTRIPGKILQGQYDYRLDGARISSQIPYAFSSLYSSHHSSAADHPLHSARVPALADLMSTQFEPLLSDAQAGELLGLHPKTVQRLARQGELPAVRIGRYWRFRASALNLWIDVHSTGQPLTERTQ